ncbi:ribbon-helix-helix domain-containing protein [Alteromonas aestuariivivens]|uniref:Ribbon-helix-helix domain-containing protein n=1 Tax=Alteromonas aestuariivivens TaxID=1938339 RepID=A0A3D8ME76_9ALTE|nr:ribbon-helix-helix domain-containing protein [Alteromonas aestuariivivens]RDV29053.1 ribbon-helix-helix domain-containing protein [Alteromonas aestuariivivens]
MSLYNLRKSRPTDNRNAVSVDEFIEDAIHYASGYQGAAKKAASHAWPDDFELGEIIPFFNQQEGTKPMRRATFTLTESCIDKLAELAEQTGIPRSRLIRIWADQQAKQKQHTNLLCSTVP